MLLPPSRRTTEKDDGKSVGLSVRASIQHERRLQLGVEQVVCRLSGNMVMSLGISGDSETRRRRAPAAAHSLQV